MATSSNAMYGFSAIVGVFGTTTTFPTGVFGIPSPQRAAGAPSTPTKTGFHTPSAHAPCTAVYDRIRQEAAACEASLVTRLVTRHDLGERNFEEHEAVGHVHAAQRRRLRDGPQHPLARWPGVARFRLEVLGRPPEGVERAGTGSLPRLLTVHAFAVGEHDIVGRGAQSKHLCVIELGSHVGSHVLQRQPKQIFKLALRMAFKIALRLPSR
eukprot:scaffold79614_cov61-Phaeocystis_antarctica.AAC.1